MGALIKDGNIYRTYEEQVEHLTNAHLEQLKINKNISDDIQKLIITSGYGGYNLVRFAFEKKGTYYKLKYSLYESQLSGDIDDYVEISSNNTDDIPAYGYFTETNRIEMSYLGDFVANYNTLHVRNVTKGTSIDITVELVEFEGSSLLDYDPNMYKRQMFNVIDDLAYNERTQYVSFDLNNDEIYNFVFIGANRSGKDGYSILSTDGVDTQDVINESRIGDLILFTENNDSGLINPNAVIGDVYLVVVGENSLKDFSYRGNIRGAVGEKGDKGDKGDTGATGEKGQQGIQGIQGIQGERGQDGASLKIHDAVLNNESELPDFDTVEVNEAYRVLNISSGNTVYDLYFKAFDGTSWSLQSNWGGTPGATGPQGPQGPQGIPGVNGVNGVNGKIQAMCNFAFIGTLVDGTVIKASFDVPCSTSFSHEHIDWDILEDFNNFCNTLVNARLSSDLVLEGSRFIMINLVLNENRGSDYGNSVFCSFDNIDFLMKLYDDHFNSSSITTNDFTYFRGSVKSL